MPQGLVRSEEQRQDRLRDKHHPLSLQASASIRPLTEIRPEQETEGCWTRSLETTGA